MEHKDSELTDYDLDRNVRNLYEQLSDGIERIP